MSEQETSERSEQRVVIVSNRLPFTVAIKEGQLILEQSAGGLVSGLSAWIETLGPARQYTYAWIGWPGVEVPPERRDELESAAASVFNAHPVYLSTAEMERFYEGFCNMTIWPLFHYFQSYVAYDQEYWETYRGVNQAFCDAVLRVARPGDIIWVHDYHLMLLPGLIRNRLPDMPIGFFLHIPFPSYELLKLMPSEWGRAILDGLLGADLVGFHSKDYTEHFSNSVQRILGGERTDRGVVAGDRIAAAGTYPMGIDFEKYAGVAQSEEVQKAASELKRTLGDSKLILSIDRLDYTKGIVNRLQGYELFLEQNPGWHEKVVLAMVVTPSRVGVQRYSETKQQIDAMVGRINGRFGGVSWVSIRYLYGFVPILPLATLYEASDVALVTPLRDGMNLISKEYLACRLDNTGVLILSIFAGAATELTEAVLINPNSKEEIAGALRTALEMPAAEQMRRNKAMRGRLRKNDVAPWAQQFIQDLVRNHYGHRAGNGGVSTGAEPATHPHSTGAAEAEKALERHHLIHRDGVLGEGKFVSLSRPPRHHREEPDDKL